MNLENLSVKQIEEKIIKKDGGTYTKHKLVLVNDDIKVTITKDDPFLGIIDGQKHIDIQLINNQKTLGEEE